MRVQKWWSDKMDDDFSRRGKQNKLHIERTDAFRCNALEKLTYQQTRWNVQQFTEESFDENRLLLSNNPLMSITLTADLLTKIAKSKRRF